MIVTIQAEMKLNDFTVRAMTPWSLVYLSFIFQFLPMFAI